MASLWNSTASHFSEWTRPSSDVAIYRGDRDGKIFHTETFEAKFLCQGDRQEQTGQFASPGSAATLSPASSTAHSFHFQKLHLLWNLPTVLQLRTAKAFLESNACYVWTSFKLDIKNIWRKSFPVGNFVSSMSHQMMVSGRSGRALINANADKSFKQLILSRGEK